MGVPCVVRGQVVAGLAYSKYRENLRFDFWYACAYCSMSEVEAQGIGWQIDHYIPAVAGGTDDYYNLMWSCERCNGAKNSLWPDAQQQADGYFYLRPDVHAFEDHFELAGFELKWLTNAGEFTAAALYLNGKLHRKLRELRVRIFNSQVAIAHGLRALAHPRLDGIKPQHRARYIQAQKEAIEQSDLLSSEAAERLAIHAQSSSQLLNAQAADLDRTKERRIHLAKLGVQFARKDK